MTAPASFWNYAIDLDRGEHYAAAVYDASGPTEEELARQEARLDG